MPATFDSRRLRNQRAMDRRLTADHRQLARALAGLVLRAATNRDEAGQPIIPPSRKALDDLKALAWERVLKPYYVGSGTDALDGPNPRSPYALLLVTGIAQATRIQAERQAALVRRLVKDREVVRWLTGPRPMLPTREMAPTIAGRITELTLTPTRDTQAGLRGVDGRIDTERARAALVRPRGTYDAFHQWVDPNGYRLSDRIWRTGIDVRSRIDLLLDYEVARGTGAVAIANMLEPFLTPGGAAGKTVKPYGREGSYSARRLARTEITAAAGRATVNAAAANPFVAQLRWRLSASHPKIDICDDYARGGPNGDGIYDIDKLPQYPPHPHCLCSILPVPSGSTADLVQTLRADIQAARGNLIDAASGGDPARARALQGTLSPEYLTQAMMSGNLDDAVAQAVRQAQTVRPEVPRATGGATRAVASEWPKFESVDEAQAWAEKNFSAWRDAISEDFQEESVLTGFKGGKSGVINGHLRGYEVEGANPKLAEHMTKLMDQSFDRPEARINQDVTVWRGMRSDLIDELRAGRPIDSVQGLVIKDKGFAATSLSKEVAETGFGVHGVVAEIRVPSGAKAVYLDMPDFHTHDYQEYEMLLPRDTQFRVISAQQENGITKLVLEVIP